MLAFDVHVDETTVPMANGGIGETEDRSIGFETSDRLLQRPAGVADGTGYLTIVFNARPRNVTLLR